MHRQKLAALCAGLCGLVLLGAGLLAPAVAEEPSSDGGQAMKGSARVPMEVTYQPAWLTWVSATTGCLKALGVECDTVDAAGYSGYGFVMVVHEELCPSGPTVFDWRRLEWGPRLLGRDVIVFAGEECGGNEADFRAAFQLATREIEAGRPVVVWGAYAPEFAIAVGVQDGSYLVRSFKPFVGEDEPPIPYNKLETPGGVYVLGFPNAVEVSRAEADRKAVEHAAAIVDAPAVESKYAAGLAAYDQWIGALEAGKAEAFGNSYNAQCWAEAKRFAAEFLARLAARNDAVAGPLGDAAAAYRQTATEMTKVAELFPFPDAEEKVKEAEARAQAIAALKSARESESRGWAALKQAAQ